MDIYSLEEELHNYSVRYKEESSNSLQTLNFLRLNGMNSFFSTNTNGHITASGWLINKTCDKALLTEHKKLNKLIQLGGHCEEQDASVKGAALRELYEESGLSEINLLKNDIFDIDIHLIPKRNNMPEHVHYDIRYIFICDEFQQIHISDESHSVDWYKITDLECRKDIDGSVKRMLFKFTNIYESIKYMPSDIDT